MNWDEVPTPRFHPHYVIYTSLNYYLFNLVGLTDSITTVLGRHNNH